ncbi:MAG: TetR/AcrR family transcriptional regulator [Ilumatobacter sp.]|uniref:TetR/AcrR family transcriptional regulator n=1 Tax=Ilumatobacter sp. TaxID=1967498 RepID=UPI00329937CA
MYSRPIAKTTTRTTTSRPAEQTNERLSGADRRTALLDAALWVLAEEGEPAVTIGSVAERAGVTRTLVYKHFDNRDDLLIELNRRESRRVDRELIALVQDTEGGFEPKMRALVRGLLDSVDRWGTVFVPLQDTAAGPIRRREGRSRHRRTLDYFADLAVADYGLDEETAHEALRILLGGLDPLMWMVRPSTPHAERARLTDRFVNMQIAALSALDERPRSDAVS